MNNRIDIVETFGELGGGGGGGGGGGHYECNSGVCAPVLKNSNSDPPKARNLNVALSATVWRQRRPRKLCLKVVGEIWVSL